MKAPWGLAWREKKKNHDSDPISATNFRLSTFARFAKTPLTPTTALDSTEFRYQSNSRLLTRAVCVLTVNGSRASGSEKAKKSMVVECHCETRKRKKHSVNQSSFGAQWIITASRVLLTCKVLNVLWESQKVHLESSSQCSRLSKCAYFCYHFRLWPFRPSCVFVQLPASSSEHNLLENSSWDEMQPWFLAPPTTRVIHGLETERCIESTCVMTKAASERVGKQKLKSVRVDEEARNNGSAFDSLMHSMLTSCWSHSAHETKKAWNRETEKLKICIPLREYLMSRLHVPVESPSLTICIFPLTAV